VENRRIELLLTRIGDYSIALHAGTIVRIDASGRQSHSDAVDLPLLLRTSAGDDVRSVTMAGSPAPVIVGSEVRLQSVQAEAVRVVPSFLSHIAERSGIEAIVVVSATEVAFLVDPRSTIESEPRT
jgi:hypothetical protein